MVTVVTRSGKGSPLTTAEMDGNFTNLATAATIGAAVNKVQYNSSGLFESAANVGVDNGDILLAPNASPATPSAGTKLVSTAVGGRPLLSAINAEGIPNVVQPFLARNRVGLWSPPGNATTLPGVMGFTALTTVGTATARNVATTNVLTRMRRLSYVSAATAGSLCSARVAVAQYTTGVGTGSALGGFTFVCRFGISDAVLFSGARMFIGMSSTTGAATNVDPSTLTNSVGIAQLSSDATQLYIVYGGTVAQGTIALGAANFPISTDTAYELALYSPSNATGVVYYQATNLGTGAVASGTLSGGVTVLPTSTVLLTNQLWRTNNATALAVALDICSIYMETNL